MEKFCSNIVYLLVSTEEGEMSDRVCGLSPIWVNQYQARVSTVEEVVRQLTALVSSGPDWPHALVQLNGDICHVPLPREGHLSVLPEGGTSSATCRRVSQIEVHQLLSSGLQVVYPIGLNGQETPMIASPPKFAAKGTDLLGGKPIYVKGDIPQPIMEEPELKVPSLGGHSSILMPSSIRATLPKAEREVSMTMEVRELLSWVVLDMSGHASANSTQKRLNPMVVLTLLPNKPGDLSSPVDTSSQMSALDDAEMGEATLEEIPAAPLPTAETPGLSSGAPPTYAGHLQEEANKALWELLATKSSIDACQWKLVWELGMALCQNESQTIESIKEAKAIYDTAIKEAKATCACSIQEAETLCSMAIRDAEAQGASQPSSLQRLHAKSIQCLEEQAIEEESKSQLDLLSACQTTL